MTFIDTHSHLYREYYQENLDEVVGRAVRSDVKQMILACVNPETPVQIAEAVNLYPDNIFALAGLHPQDVNDNYEADLEAVRSHIGDRNIVGIGETGLDFYWDKTYEVQQKAAFRQQLCWARDLHMPLSMHIRNAYPDAIEILGQFKSGELSGVIHCFSGGIQEAKWAIQHGYVIGVGGIVTFKNNKLKEMLPEIGLQHIVLETDAPYLAPVPHRGTPNESSYIPLIAQTVADVFQVSVNDVADQTTETARRIFKKLPAEQ